MKLVDILARDLKEWPQDFPHAHLSQSVSGRVAYVINNKERMSAGNFEKADDWLDALVDKRDWERARALGAEQKWDGANLPPAGSECEVRFPSDSKPVWEPAEILYAGSKFTAMRFADGEVIEIETSRCEMRPPQSDEQIAAEERENAIAEMQAAISLPVATPRESFLYALYDAGYRKPD